MLRCELERVRPSPVPCRRRQGDLRRELLERVHPPPVPCRRRQGNEVLCVLARSRPLTDRERGMCMAYVTLLVEEIGDLRRSVRQSNRAITNAQKRAQNVVCV